MTRPPGHLTKWHDSRSLHAVQITCQKTLPGRHHGIERGHDQPAGLGGRQLAEPEARAFAFTTLVIANLALIFSNRSRSLLASLTAPNPILWIVAGVALSLLALSLYLPFLAGVFRFAPLPFVELGAAFGLGLVSVAWFGLLKRTRHT